MQIVLLWCYLNSKLCEMYKTAFSILILGNFPAPWGIHLDPSRYQLSEWREYLGCSHPRTVSAFAHAGERIPEAGIRSSRVKGWHRMETQSYCSWAAASAHLPFWASLNLCKSSFWLLGSFQFCGQIFFVVVADWKLISIITQAYVL